MKNDFQPAFRGYVRVPMTDDDEDLAKIKYVGDWKTKRQRIIKKPRKYHLTFCFRGRFAGRGVETVQILQRDDFLELSAYIYTFGEEMLAQMGGTSEIDLKQSYVEIRA